MEDAIKHIQNVQFFLNVVEKPMKELFRKWLLSSGKRIPNKGSSVLNLSSIPESKDYLCFDIDGEKIRMGIMMTNTLPNIEWIVEEKYLPIREELGKLLFNVVSLFEDFRSNNPALLPVMVKQEVDTTIGLYSKNTKYEWFLAPDLIRD
jgi:hypothetical protein